MTHLGNTRGSSVLNRFCMCRGGNWSWTGCWEAAGPQEDLLLRAAFFTLSPFLPCGNRDHSHSGAAEELPGGFPELETSKCHQSPAPLPAQAGSLQLIPFAAFSWSDKSQIHCLSPHTIFWVKDRSPQALGTVFSLPGTNSLLGQREHWGDASPGCRLHLTSLVLPKTHPWGCGRHRDKANLPGRKS